MQCAYDHPSPERWWPYHFAATLLGVGTDNAGKVIMNCTTIRVTLGIAATLALTVPATAEAAALP